MLSFKKGGFPAETVARFGGLEAKMKCFFQVISSLEEVHILMLGALYCQFQCSNEVHLLRSGEDGDYPAATGDGGIHK